MCVYFVPSYITEMPLFIIGVSHYFIVFYQVCPEYNLRYSVWNVLVVVGCAKLIEFSPLRSRDVVLPQGAVFVIAHSLVKLNKAATADFNCRVIECRLASQVKINFFMSILSDAKNVFVFFQSFKWQQTYPYKWKLREMYGVLVVDGGRFICVMRAINENGSCLSCLVR